MKYVTICLSLQAFNQSAHAPSIMTMSSALVE
jgi:hypothetical protein